MKQGMKGSDSQQLERLRRKNTAKSRGNADAYLLTLATGSVEVTKAVAAPVTVEKDSVFVKKPLHFTKRNSNPMIFFRGDGGNSEGVEP